MKITKPKVSMLRKLQVEQLTKLFKKLGFSVKDFNSETYFLQCIKLNDVSIAINTSFNGDKVYVENGFKFQQTKRVEIKLDKEFTEKDLSYMKKKISSVIIHSKKGFDSWEKHFNKN